MAAATIVKVWRQHGQVYLALRVDEGERDKNNNPMSTEYIGSVEETPEFAALGKPQQKTMLVAAAKAVRDQQQATTRVDVAGITGAVTV